MTTPRSDRSYVRYRILAAPPLSASLAHSVILRARPDDLREVDEAMPPWCRRPIDLEQVRELLTRGLAWYVLDEEDDVVGLFGLVHCAKNVGSGWFVATPEIGARQLRAVARAVRENLPGVAARQGMTRVEVLAPTARREQSMWLRRMGFCYECTKRGWGDGGRSYDVWAMVLV